MGYSEIKLVKYGLEYCNYPFENAYWCVELFNLKDIPLYWDKFIMWEYSTLVMLVLLLIPVIPLCVALSRVLRREGNTVRKTLNKGNREMGTPPKLTHDQKVILEDALCDGIEEAVFQNKMTRGKANFWYKKLAYDYDLPGLVSPAMFSTSEGRKRRKYRQKVLKDAVAYRLSNGAYRTKANLPSEDTIQVPPKKKEPLRKSKNPKLDAIMFKS